MPPPRRRGRRARPWRSLRSRARRSTPWRGNLRDPLVAELIGPGKPFELEAAEIGGAQHEVFKGAHVEHQPSLLLRGLVLSVMDV